MIPRRLLLLCTALIVLMNGIVIAAVATSLPERNCWCADVGKGASW